LCGFDQRDKQSLVLIRRAAILWYAAYAAAPETRDWE
jgi:hypothetical protein